MPMPLPWGAPSPETAASNKLTDAILQYSKDYPELKKLLQVSNYEDAYDVQKVLLGRLRNGASLDELERQLPGISRYIGEYLPALGIEADKGTVSKANASEALKAFAEHMIAPIDPADPAVQALVKTAGSAAQGDARSRGLQGGYAVQNTEHGVTNALNQAYLARSQLGSQALAQAGQLDLGQANLAMTAYGQQYQSQLAQMQAQQANNQAAGSAIGAIGGMVGSYFGVPGLNASSGAQLGGGLAGMGGGGARVPTYSFTPPSAVGSGNRGGL